MSDRTSHIGKTQAEKAYYKRRIHEVNYDPTIDESLEFDNSDSTEKDFSTTKGGKLQKVGLNIKIVDYFRENAIGILLSITGMLVLLIMTVLYVNLNREVGVIQERVELTKETIDNISKSSLDQEQKIEGLNTSIVGIDKELEFIRQLLMIIGQKK